VTRAGGSRRWLRRAAWAAGVGLVGAAAFVAAANAHVLRVGGEGTYARVADVPPRAVAIVLGARVFADGTPSLVLEDRLATALDLYRRGKVRRILVTGDNGSNQYDEVTVMQRWLVARGVVPAHVQRDHAGFRTLDSMARAAQVFRVRHAVVCTQRFHLARSVFLARRYGLDAVGAEADRRVYLDARRDATREVIARAVAFSDVYITRRRPRFLGEQIPLE
jgi:SanA protein